LQVCLIYLEPHYIEDWERLVFQLTIKLLTDQQLDHLIYSIKQDHPNDGEVLIKGHLLSRGIKVTREAMRDSIHRVDHANVEACRGSVIHHRVYNVPHPNSVWHVDGHQRIRSGKPNSLGEINSTQSGLNCYHSTLNILLCEKSHL